MMVRRFVANSAIRAYLLRSPHRPLKYPHCLNPRSYSESASIKGSQYSKHDERPWKNMFKENWEAWVKAAAGGGLVGINFPFFLLKHADYRRLSVDMLPAICGFQIGSKKARDVGTSPNAILQSSKLLKKDLYFQILSTILSHAKPMSLKSRRLLHQLSNLMVIRFLSERMEPERQV